MQGFVLSGSISSSSSFSSSPPGCPPAYLALNGTEVQLPDYSRKTQGYTLMVTGTSLVQVGGCGYCLVQLGGWGYSLEQVGGCCYSLVQVAGVGWCTY